MSIYTDPNVGLAEKFTQWAKAEVRGKIEKCCKWGKENPESVAEYVRTFIAKGWVTVTQVENILAEVKTEHLNSSLWEPEHKAKIRQRFKTIAEGVKLARTE